MNVTLSNTKKLVLSGVFIALGILLPYIFGSNQQMGNAFLPMHLPILLCGFICGWQYGIIVGFMTPLLKSLLFSMPPINIAIAMAFELATYGFLAGFFYKKFPKKLGYTFLSLILSMIGGRIVWGIVKVIQSNLQGFNFTWGIFFSEAVLNAIPGIIIQIILIPLIISSLQRSKLIDHE